MTDDQARILAMAVERAGKSACTSSVAIERIAEEIKLGSKRIAAALITSAAIIFIGAFLLMTLALKVVGTWSTL